MPGNMNNLMKQAQRMQRQMEEQQAELVELQRKILSTVWQYVKPGGTLVYSTCTINKRENDRQIDAFLRKHPDFCENPLADVLSDKLLYRIRGGRLQLFPHIDGIDGFFIASLKRKGIE